MNTLAKSVLLASLTFASPVAASAQRQGAIEIGGFGRFSKFTDTLQLKTGLGGGGRVGIYLFKNLLAEMDLSYAEVDVDRPKNGDIGRDTLLTVSHPLWAYRLTYNARLNDNVKLLLGGGYAYDAYGRVRVVAPRGGGPHGLVGLRFIFNDRLSARLEGIAHYVTPASKKTQPYPRAKGLNYGAQAGLSLSFFTRERVTRTDTVRIAVPAIAATPARRDTVVVQRRDTVQVAGKPGRPIVVGSINFGYNLFDLTPEAKLILDRIAESFADPANITRTMTITGHTDVKGPEGYNEKLGQERADQAKAYIVSKGVSESRIIARSAGETELLGTNEDETSRATSRRVVIMLSN